MLVFSLGDLEQIAYPHEGEPFRTAPVIERIQAPDKPPAELFNVFKNMSRHCFILESLEDKKRWGRWTFLGFSPKLEVSCVNGNLSIKNGADIKIANADPAVYLNQIIADNKGPPSKLFPNSEDLPPFCGGLVGYFSFEYIKYSEKKLQLDVDNSDFKDFDLMLFDKIVAWDNLKNTLMIIINIKTDALAENYNNAVNEIETLKRTISEGKALKPDPLKLKSDFTELFDKPAYCAMVEKAKHYIKEGDIFQVVLANQVEADVSGSLFDTYKILRISNPSPYMFYFSSDDIEIAGASPETLVKLQDGAIWTFPLAGTRPRGATNAEDAKLEEELLADPKELAEHNMLVDLGRNDLGKLCEFSSVVVEKYMSIERFSHVMHIGSTVRGILRSEFSALDAIASALPAGTLSGAPKIRACEIIRELENKPRGIYGGAIGYIGLSGNMDTCISIRIAYKKNGKVYVRSGAGIVADSIPENEYQECRNKMRAVIEALQTQNAQNIKNTEMTEHKKKDQK